MLHIILGILKIAGILIGILLLFLLTVLLALLLVPVRYRVQVSKAQKVPEADVRLSWLLQMVSLTISVGKGQKLSILFRLFGYRLPFFQSRVKNSTGRTGKKRKTKKTDFEAEHSRINNADSGEYHKHDINPEAGRNQRQYTDSGPDQNQEQDTDSASAENQEYDTDSVSDQNQEQDIDSGSDRNQDKNTDFRRKLQNIRFKIQSVCDRIKRLPDRIGRVYAMVTSIPKKVSRLLMRIDSIRKKPVQLLEMIEEYGISDILRKLKDELLFLMKHYSPRHIHGYLDFGTGDPALTGELTGLIYLVLPAKADDFAIHPDFYEAKLEAEFSCTGHIRAIHLIRMVLRLLMDRQVRRVIRKIMKRGD